MAAWPLSVNTSRKDNVQAHRFAGAPAHLQIVGILNGLFVRVRASSGLAAVGVGNDSFFVLHTFTSKSILPAWNQIIVAFI